MSEQPVKQIVEEKTRRDPAELRNSTDRKQAIDSFVKGILPARTRKRVEVTIDPNTSGAYVAPATPEEVYHSDQSDIKRREAKNLVRNVDADYLMVISGQGVDLENSFIDDQITADIINQFGLAIHETLHILKTSTSKTNQLISTEIEPQYEDTLQKMHNTIEDGAIENELKTGDEFSQRAAARITYIRSLMAKSPEELLEFVDQDQIEYNFGEGLDKILYEEFIYSSGISDALLDENNDKIVCSDGVRTRLLEIRSAVQRARNDIFSMRSDVDGRYRIDREASINRTHRLIKLWKEDIKPHIEETEDNQESQQGGNQQQDTGENAESNQQQGGDQQPDQQPSDSQPQPGESQPSEDQIPDNISEDDIVDDDTDVDGETTTIEVSPDDFDDDKLQDIDSKPDISRDKNLEDKDIEDIVDDDQTEQGNGKNNTDTDQSGSEDQESNSPVEDTNTESDPTEDLDPNGQSDGTDPDSKDQQQETGGDSATEDNQEGNASETEGGSQTDSAETDGDRNQSPSEQTGSEGESSEGESGDRPQAGDSTQSDNSEPTNDGSEVDDNNQGQSLGQTSLGEFSEETGGDEGANPEESTTPDSQEDDRKATDPKESGDSEESSDSGESDDSGESSSGKESGNEGDEESDKSKESPGSETNTETEEDTSTDSQSPLDEEGESESGDDNFADPSELPNQSHTEETQTEAPNHTTGSDPNESKTDAEDSADTNNQNQTPAHNDDDISEEDFEQDRQTAERELDDQNIDPDSLEKDLNDLSDSSDSDNTQSNNSGSGAGEATINGLEILPEPEQSIDHDWETIKEESRQVTHRLRTMLEESKRSRKRRGLSAGSAIDSSNTYRLQQGDPRAFTYDNRGDEKEYSFVIVLDRSGSMGKHGRIELAVQALARFAAGCEELGIKISIIDFADNECRYIKTPSIETEYCLDRILSTENGGGTSLADAYKVARDIADEQDEKSIIIGLTDDRAPNVEPVKHQITQSKHPICSLTISTHKKKGNPDDKAAELDRVYTQSDIIFEEEKLSQKLDQFAALIGYF